MAHTYNRYEKLISNGIICRMPLVRIPNRDSDYYVTYKRGTTKLNNLSYEYYSDPNYDWLILMANPSVGALEYNIVDGTTLRIPYPLASALEDYKKGIDEKRILYGL